MNPEIITAKSGQTVQVWAGDCLASLRAMQPASVHCCVTSPPYFGLRDYGNDGQIGLEPTPDAYVAKLVEVFREVRRVLRDDGTLWLNLGDTYAANRGYQVPDGKWQDVGNDKGMNAAAIGLKPKDLIGIPWRVAFALQADGWYLRSDIIWHKPNPMPESVTDRPTKAHEHLFLLAKSEQYYYDAAAIAEPAKHGGEQLGIVRGAKRRADAMGVSPSGNEAPGSDATVPDTRNKRSVWTVTTHGYPEAHFATFPPKLIEPCIKAGCPGQCCSKCGMPWAREVAKERTFQSGSGQSGNPIAGKHGDKMQGGGETVDIRRGPVLRTRTIGFAPGCACAAPAIGGTVLDPFGGSFTTAEVALELGCSAVLCELNPAYIEMGKRRLSPLIKQARMFA